MRWKIKFDISESLSWAAQVWIVKF